MDAVQWLAVSSVTQFLLITHLLFRPEPRGQDLPQFVHVAVGAGGTALLVSQRAISVQQYPAVKKYVDELSAEAGVKFVLVDGAFRVVPIGAPNPETLP